MFLLTQKFISSFRMSLISPEDYYASRGSQAPIKTAPTISSNSQNPGRSWPQGYAPGPGRFQSGGGDSSGHKSGGGVKKKGKKGNAFLHLENFTSVQQLALFEPSIEIVTQQLKPNRFIKVGCVLPIVISSAVILTQYRDDDHREDAPTLHCNLYES